MGAKDKAILNLMYIRSLGDILNECAGHKVELSTDTLTGIGGQVVDLVEQALEGMEKLSADAMDQADKQAA